MKENLEDFEIHDESGDKKYFTIVPNYILNHSTANAQALYLQLKRLAGENGLAYPSRDYLMKRLHFHHITLKREMNYLLEKGWIKESGTVDVKTAGGAQKMKAYKIVDIWKLNVNSYKNPKGGIKETTPRSKGGIKETTQGGIKETTKEYINNKEQDRVLVPSTLSVASDEGEPFNSDQYIKEKLIKAKDKRRDLWIIGQYLKARQIKYQSEAQVGVAIKRHLRAAQSLKEFSDADLRWASTYCEDKSNGKWDWNLDTMVKALTSGTRELA